MAKQNKFVPKGYRWPNSKLVYLHDGPQSGSSRRVVVRCDCGVVKSVVFRDVQSGKTLSCGCHKAAVTTQRNIDRGEGITKHWLYGRWHSMHLRCYQPGDVCYSTYGAKGIKVCYEWFDFWNYVEWVEINQGMISSDYFEVHRSDTDGPYDPRNCACIDPVEHRKLHDALRKTQK